ncbi:hypothetical protein Tco_0137370, partial [Tanacetum coccineum]
TPPKPPPSSPSSSHHHHHLVTTPTPRTIATTTAPPPRVRVVFKAPSQRVRGLTVNQEKGAAKGCVLAVTAD